MERPPLSRMETLCDASLASVLSYLEVGADMARVSRSCKRLQRAAALTWGPQLVLVDAAAQQAPAPLYEGHRRPWRLVSRTIRAAVAMCAAEDVIVVTSGVYDETLVMPAHTVWLRAMDRDSPPVLAPTSSLPAVVAVRGGLAHLEHFALSASGATGAALVMRKSALSLFGVEVRGAGGQCVEVLGGSVLHARRCDFGHGSLFFAGEGTADCSARMRAMLSLHRVLKEALPQTSLVRLEVAYVDAALSASRERDADAFAACSAGGRASGGELPFFPSLRRGAPDSRPPPAEGASAFPADRITSNYPLADAASRGLGEPRSTVVDCAFERCRLCAVASARGRNVAVLALRTAFPEKCRGCGAARERDAPDFAAPVAKRRLMGGGSVELSGVAALACPES